MDGHCWTVCCLLCPLPTAHYCLTGGDVSITPTAQLRLSTQAEHITQRPHAQQNPTLPHQNRSLTHSTTHSSHTVLVTYERYRLCFPLAPTLCHVGLHPLAVAATALFLLPLADNCSAVILLRIFRSFSVCRHPQLAASAARLTL